MKNRTCTRCNQNKPLTEDFFKKRKNYSEGFHTWCIICLNKYNADYQTKDRNENPEFYRSREFQREMKKYGTTVEGYRDKLITQNGLCALCDHLSHHHGTLQRLQVDHDHACCDKRTKSCGACLRGLLCADCNIKLSYLEQFVPELGTLAPIAGTWTARAIAYLKSYEKPRFTDLVTAYLALGK